MGAVDAGIQERPPKAAMLKIVEDYQAFTRHYLELETDIKMT